MNRTTVVVGAGIMLCAISLFLLQRRFDKSDHDKSIRLVRHMTSPHRPDTFEGFLAAKHGGQAGAWESEVTGGCRGVARVTWSLPGNPPTIYAWDVEIPAQGVHPTPSSPEGERLLAEFSESNPLPPLELPPLTRPEAAQSDGGGNK